MIKLLLLQIFRVIGKDSYYEVWFVALPSEELTLGSHRAGTGKGLQEMASHCSHGNTEKIHN